MQTYFKYIRSSIFSKNRGFTLMELMVVISIALIITTALIVQQNKWNDQLTVSTQAYELALMIRQAQIYSLAVREDVGNPSATGDKFNTGYGVYFDEDYVDANGKINRYIYFADRDGDKKYDSGEAIETKTFIRGVTINRFCGVKNVGQHEDRCSPDAGNIHKLTITFFRPETKANILLQSNGVGDPQSDNVIPPAKIYLRSSGGKESSIIVDTSGQVSIMQ